MLRALAYSDYLRSHAEKIYGLATDGHMDAARLIVQRRSKLPEAFTARDVLRKGWTGLSTINDVNEALETLAEYGQVYATTLDTGGRPSVIYRFAEGQS